MLWKWSVLRKVAESALCEDKHAPHGVDHRTEKNAPADELNRCVQERFPAKKTRKGLFSVILHFHLLATCRTQHGMKEAEDQIYF